MADIFGLQHVLEPPLLPEQYEVYKARKRPSVLTVPGPSVVFDIESAPLTVNPALKDTTIDPAKPQTRSQPRREARKTPHGESPRTPPPRVPFDDVPTADNTAYANSSPKVRKRERDWEKLRQYFAWLPKLVIQKTFDCTTQYARIPMSAHLQRHFRSPFPGLNDNRRSEPVATDTIRGYA